MKKMLYKLMAYAVPALFFFAVVVAKSACAMEYYQPEVPASLRD